MNEIDRFHLVQDVVARVPGVKDDPAGKAAVDFCRARLAEHHDYIRAHGEDMPEIRNWRWNA
jgi:xylulose-5-phosphate/fructose-6-phosphate phosphoketolase